MKYTLTVSFETDREMTADEYDELIHSVVVQVQEPNTRTDGEIFDVVPSDLRTTAITIKLEPGQR